MSDDLILSQQTIFNIIDFPTVASADNQPASNVVREIKQGDESLFAAIDLIMWAKDEDYKTARQSLKDIKKMLQNGDNQLVGFFYQLKAMAPDGKMRNIDFVSREQALRLIQEVPGKKSGRLKDWLAKVGNERLEEMEKPGLGTQRARQRDLALLQRNGYSASEAAHHLEQRIEGVDTFKILMETITKVCDNPSYAVIINTEYMALFGMVASELRKTLATKSIRESLPRLQYQYLITAEQSLNAIMQHADHMTQDKVLGIVDRVVKPLGAMLRDICDSIGIDTITGRKLLK